MVNERFARATWGLVAFLLVVGILGLAWAVWGFRAFPRGHRVRAGVVLGLLFLGLEAMIGRALVLKGLVATDDSGARAVVMGLHLINTFLLLGVVALTGAWAGGIPRPTLRSQRGLGLLLAASLVGVVALGASLENGLTQMERNGE